MLSKNSYIICGTPRTGSSLLCSLLKSTNLAGYPESYFRQQDIVKWAVQLGVIDGIDKIIEPKEYVAVVVRAGSTDNGIFALRVMWGTLHEMIQNFLKVGGPDAKADYEVLSSVFGQTKFIHLQRSIAVAQAISLRQ